MGKTKKFQQESSPQRSRVPLVVLITIIYFAMLLGLIYLTFKFNIPLYEPAGSQTPGSWLYLLWSFYYGVPFTFALLLGISFKPFWPHFRNLLIIILAMQGIYSVDIFFWRSSYLERSKEVIHHTRLARIKVMGFKYKFRDNNKDGLIDEVDLLFRCDMSDYPPGRYILHAIITQKGEGFPDSDIGTYSINLLEEKPKVFTATFNFNPRVFEPYFESGEFEANLLVQGITQVDAEGQRIINYNRWSPFLRYTSWTGQGDPDIAPGRIDLENIPKVGTFLILPLDVKRSQVIFKGFVKDFGRDIDGDGLFEQLVVVMDLDSKYEGPVFVQGLLQGYPYPIFSESSLKIGYNELEFVIDGKYLHELGTDGPYEISNIQLFNKNPECHTQECLKRIKPFFSLFLDDYVTRGYSLKQFK